MSNNVWRRNRLNQSFMSINRVSEGAVLLGVGVRRAVRSTLTRYDWDYSQARIILDRQKCPCFRSNQRHNPKRCGHTPRASGDGGRQGLRCSKF